MWGTIKNYILTEQKLVWYRTVFSSSHIVKLNILGSLQVKDHDHIGERKIKEEFLEFENFIYICLYLYTSS